MMEVKKVGDLFQKDITKYQEGCIFDITDNGAELYIFLNNPNSQEIKNCKEGNLRFSFLKLDSVIFFIAKIEGIEILDAPYNVHLSNTLTKINHPGKNQGLSLVVYLINARTGKIEVMRLIGLGESFSRNLIDTIKEQENEPFSEAMYDSDIKKAYMKYSSKQLEKMSKYYFNIKNKE